jgi:hypothetical protein
MNDTKQPQSPCPPHGPTAKEPLPCDNCNEPSDDFCVSCDLSFCKACWPKQAAHRREKAGHEKTIYNVAKRLEEILKPTTDAKIQQTLHGDDARTTWFGVVRDADNNSVFQDYGRYMAIMAESFSTQWRERYPQLVSFIGQTGNDLTACLSVLCFNMLNMLNTRLGAGKSTIIKMLIDFIGDQSGTSGFRSPVVGSPDDNIPTSGDVHLYADPPTNSGERPVLYADCEGFEGGEKLPRGARLREIEETNNETPKRARPSSFRLHHKVKNRAHKPMKWATSPEKRKREYTVTQLYPRLLYTFSDVVVFVLRNSRYAITIPAPPNFTT